jgi:hypothetical protein
VRVQPHSRLERSWARRLSLSVFSRSATLTSCSDGTPCAPAGGMHAGPRPSGRGAGAKRASAGTDGARRDEHAARPVARAARAAAPGGRRVALVEHEPQGVPGEVTLELAAAAYAEHRGVRSRSPRSPASDRRRKPSASLSGSADRHNCLRHAKAPRSGPPDHLAASSVGSISP